MLGLDAGKTLQLGEGSLVEAQAGFPGEGQPPVRGDGLLGPRTLSARGCPCKSRGVPGTHAGSAPLFPPSSCVTKVALRWLPVMGGSLYSGDTEVGAGGPAPPVPGTPVCPSPAQPRWPPQLRPLGPALGHRDRPAQWGAVSLLTLWAVGGRLMRTTGE